MVSELKVSLLKSPNWQITIFCFVYFYYVNHLLFKIIAVLSSHLYIIQLTYFKCKVPFLGHSQSCKTITSFKTVVPPGRHSIATSSNFPSPFPTHAQACVCFLSSLFGKKPLFHGLHPPARQDVEHW